MRTSPVTRAAVLGSVCALACAGPARKPAQLPAPTVTQVAAPPATQPAVRADIHFTRDMIAHHAQAIEMSRMAPSHAANANLKLLAERIDISQNDEIKRMTTWLNAHGLSAEPMTGHEHMQHAGMDVTMPGMLSAADFERLGAATGNDFDRLFLQYMIRHHEGALTMVDQLFAQPGLTLDADLYQLASSIDADQRAEIARMRTLLSNIQ